MFQSFEEILIISLSKKEKSERSRHPLKMKVHCIDIVTAVFCVSMAFLAMFAIDQSQKWKDMSPGERAIHHKGWYKSRCCDVKECRIKYSCYDSLRSIFGRGDDQASVELAKRFIDKFCIRKFDHRDDEYHTYCSVEAIDRI